MIVDLDVIKEKFIPIAMEEHPTGDEWLDARYAEDIPIIGHTNPYYKLFYLLAQELEPEFSVELGSHRATAAAHLAAGNPDGLVYTIDIHREDKVAQKDSIATAARYCNLVYINGWTWDAHVIAEVRREAPIDLLYVDAWHKYEYVKREWELYSPMLSDEALVICDDIVDADPDGTADMVKFWEELDYEKFLNTKLHDRVPMGFVRFVR